MGLSLCTVAAAVLDAPRLGGPASPAGRHREPPRPAQRTFRERFLTQKECFLRGAESPDCVCGREPSAWAPGSACPGEGPPSERKRLWGPGLGSRNATYRNLRY